MTKFINGCVCCPPELGCLGDRCPNRYTALVCDKCGYEADELYVYGDAQLCVPCIRELDPELEIDELEEVRIL